MLAIIKCKPKQILNPRVLYNLLYEASKFYQKMQFAVEEIVELCFQHIDSNLNAIQIQNVIHLLNDQALLLKRDNCYELL